MAARCFEPGTAPQQRSEEEATSEALEALCDQIAVINVAAEAALERAEEETAARDAGREPKEPVAPPSRLQLEVDSRLYAGCTGAAAALNPVEQSGGAEDYGLMVGEDVGRILIFQRAGHDVALREPAPA